MNADSIHIVGRIPKRTSSRIGSPGLSFLIPLLLEIGLGLAAPAARADFSGRYALTPPDPGNYLVFASSPQQFGNWTASATASALSVNTLLVPGSLILDTHGVSRPVGLFFFAQAAAAGTVSFDYTIAGQGTGSLQWFNSGPVFGNPAPIAVVSDLVPTPTSGSIPVQAGDIFGFEILATGVFLGETGQRTATIGNFSAPVPEPSTATLISCAVGLLAWKVSSRRRKPM